MFIFDQVHGLRAERNLHALAKSFAMRRAHQAWRRERILVQTTALLAIERAQ